MNTKDWGQYSRKGLAEMRPYVPGEDLSAVSVAAVDTPSQGGMIARNPDNHSDQWYVAADYFAKNFAPSNAMGRDFLSRLREANVQRVARFGHGGLREWSPMQWGCALAGKVGELCNVLKKFERQMPTDPEPDVLEGMIGQEIADVLIYLDLLAAWYSIDLARVVETKFNASSKRFGFPERL